MRGKKRAGGEGLQTQTRRGANDRVTSVEVTNSGDSGIDVLELFREGYVANAWFQSRDNLEGLEYSTEDGLWYLDNRVVVPAGEARQRVLEESHDSPYTGHFGKFKVVVHQINRDFWWPGWRKVVENCLLNCPVCQRNKAQSVKKAGLLQPLPISRFKSESVSMDFITQLSVTKAGHDAIVVFVDRLTKMVHFAPTTTSVSAEGVAHLFNHYVFKHHGMPSELILDSDPRFTSKFWTELARLLGTKLKMSTAFHPQTDGETERVNRVLEDYLRHYVSPTQDDWDEWLPVTLAEWQWLYCSDAIRIRSENNVPQAAAMELRSAFFQKLSTVLFTPFPLVKSQSADWCYLNLSTQKKYVTEQTRPSR
jgi:hypothetical protein